MNTNCRASIHSYQTMSYSAPPSRVNYISEIPYITHPIYDISDPLIKLLNLTCIPSMLFKKRQFLMEKIIDLNDSGCTTSELIIFMIEIIIVTAIISSLVCYLTVTNYENAC